MLGSQTQGSAMSMLGSQPQGSASSMEVSRAQGSAPSLLGSQPQGSYINLRVLDQLDNCVAYSIKKHTPLRKLMDVHCSKRGLQNSLVCFIANGERIAPNDTAEKLGPDDDDLIETIETIETKKGSHIAPSSSMPPLRVRSRERRHSLHHALHHAKSDPGTLSVPNLAIARRPGTPRRR